MAFGPLNRRILGKIATALTLVVAVATGLSACGAPSFDRFSPEQVREKWERFCSEPPSKEKVKKWEEDLNCLMEQLEKGHKNLFHKISKEQFQAAAKKLKDELPRLDDMGCFAEFAKLVSLVGDSHTSVRYNIPLHWFPIYPYWFKEGIYIVAAGEECAGLIGKRLVKVGGVDIEEVYERLSSVIAHENQAVLKYELCQVVRCAELLKYFGYAGSLDEGSFTFADSDGNLETTKVRTLPHYTGGMIVRLEDRFNQSDTVVSRQNRGEMYWYKYVAQDKMLYFQYNVCREDQSKPVRQLVREVMDLVNNQDVSKFVLDLRNNGGGDSRVIQPLIDALARCEKINKRGHLFVVIGRTTFSSAILNALVLKNKTEAIFVGEPTRGKPNHFGEVFMFALPNSGLTIMYSTKYFTYSKDDSESLFPDVLIEPTFHDLASNKDPVIERIISSY